MDFILFSLQFSWMGMGKLLCFCQKAPLGKPWIYAWTDASTLWIGRNGCPDRDDSGQR